MKSLLAALALALTGGLVLPIAGYLTGKRTIGAYAGRLGLSDYLGSIYTAAFRGELLAWWLLLTPVRRSTGCRPHPRACACRPHPCSREWHPPTT